MRFLRWKQYIHWSTYINTRSIIILELSAGQWIRCIHVHVHVFGHGMEGPRILLASYLELFTFTFRIAGAFLQHKAAYPWNVVICTCCWFIIYHADCVCYLIRYQTESYLGTLYLWGKIFEMERNVKDLNDISISNQWRWWYQMLKKSFWCIGFEIVRNSFQT